MFPIIIIARLLLADPSAFAPCAHAPGEPHPQISSSDQATAASTIREVVRAAGGSENLTRYLLTVARRESSLRPGVIHQRPRDLEAARAAWRRLRRQLGRTSPFASDPDIWLTYGLFGQVSAYTAAHLPGGDPRRLCDAGDATRAYLARARSLLRKLARARCIGGAPRWIDLHRALQRGRLCPRGPGPDPFVAQAQRAGLDPWARVRARDLGEEVAAE